MNTSKTLQKASARRAPSPRKAFTLVELVVSIGITSVLMLTVFGILSQAIGTWTATLNESGVARQANRVLDTLASDLSAFTSYEGENAWMEFYRGEAMDRFGSYKTSTLYLITSTKDGPEDAEIPEEQLRAIAWGFRRANFGTTTNPQDSFVLSRALMDADNTFSGPMRQELTFTSLETFAKTSLRGGFLGLSEPTWKTIDHGRLVDVNKDWLDGPANIFATDILDIKFTFKALDSSTGLVIAIEDKHFAVTSEDVLLFAGLDGLDPTETFDPADLAAAIIALGIAFDLFEIAEDALEAAQIAVTTAEGVRDAAQIAIDNAPPVDISALTTAVTDAEDTLNTAKETLKEKEDAHALALQKLNDAKADALPYQQAVADREDELVAAEAAKVVAEEAWIAGFDPYWAAIDLSDAANEIRLQAITDRDAAGSILNNARLALNKAKADARPYQDAVATAEGIRDAAQNALNNAAPSANIPALTNAVTNAALALANAKETLRLKEIAQALALDKLNDAKADALPYQQALATAEVNHELAKQARRQAQKDYDDSFQPFYDAVALRTPLDHAHQQTARAVRIADTNIVNATTDLETKKTNARPYQDAVDDRQAELERLQNDLTAAENDRDNPPPPPSPSQTIIDAVTDAEAELQRTQDEYDRLNDPSYKANLQGLYAAASNAATIAIGNWQNALYDNSPQGEVDALDLIRKTKIKERDDAQFAFNGVDQDIRNAKRDRDDAQTALTNAEAARDAAAAPDPQYASYAAERVRLAQKAFDDKDDELTQARADLKPWQDAVTEAERILAAAVDEKANAERAHAPALAAFEAAQQVVLDRWDDQIGYWNELEKKKEEERTASAAVTTAKTALKPWQDALNIAQGKFDTADMELTTAQQDVATADTNLTNAQTALTNAQGPQNALTTALTNAQTALTKAEADLKPWQDALDTAQTAFDTAQTNYDKAVKDLADANAEHDRLEAEVSRTLAEAVANWSATDRFIKAVTTAENNLQAAKTALKPWQDAIDAAQLAFDAADRELTAAQQAVTDAETNLQAAQDALTTAQGPQNTLKAAEDELTRLRGELADAQRAFDDAERKATAAAAEVARLEGFRDAVAAAAALTPDNADDPDDPSDSFRISAALENYTIDQVDITLKVLTPKGSKLMRSIPTSGTLAERIAAFKAIRDKHSMTFTRQVNLIKGKLGSK